MEITFKTKILEAFYERPIKELGKHGIDKKVIISYRKRIDILKYASDLRLISNMNGLNLEKLKSGKYIGCYSIRVNDQYRIIFTEGPTGQLSVLILELSKHYE